MTPDKLCKILGMLGSAHDGERAAAAAMADRMVREAGLMWSDIIVSVPDEMTVLIRDCLRSQHLLSEWELEFFQSIERRSRWTDKQRAKAKEIWKVVRNRV